MDNRLALAGLTPTRGLAVGGMDLPVSGSTSPPVPGAEEGAGKLAQQIPLQGGPDTLPKSAQLEKALAELNHMMRDRQRELEFSIDEASGRIILKVIHAESGEIIRQIPAEELLTISRAFIEGTGSLIEDEA